MSSPVKSRKINLAFFCLTNKIDMSTIITIKLKKFLELFFSASFNAQFTDISKLEFCLIMSIVCVFIYLMVDSAYL